MREYGASTGTTGSIQNVNTFSTKVMLNHQRVDQDDKNRWLLDGGSNAHIINDFTKADFIPESIPSDVVIYAGNTTLRPVCRGRATLSIPGLGGEKILLHLRNVLYVPGYHLNIVAAPVMRKQGLFLDERDDIWYDSSNAKVTRVVRRSELPFLNTETIGRDAPTILKWPTEADGRPKSVN